jgi:hypothetical protein
MTRKPAKPSRTESDALLGALYDSPKPDTRAPAAPGDIPRYEPPDTYVDPLTLPQTTQDGNMGLGPEWFEGWKQQVEQGYDAPCRPFENGTYSPETGFVSESDQREAEFRAEQERQRDQEARWDPWKARMRKLDVL